MQPNERNRELSIAELITLRSLPETIRRGRPAAAVRYPFAVAATLLVFGVQYLLLPPAGAAFLYLGFFLGAVAAAGFGGWGPGMLATVLGLLLTGPLLPAGGFLHFSEADDPFAPVRFAVGCVSTIAICETLIRARERARRAESELRETYEGLQCVADCAPALIWISGPDKLCTWFNQPWLQFRGRTMEQEVGDGWTEGVHPEHLKAYLDTYNSSFEARAPFAMEYRLRNRDNEWRWLLDRGVPRYGSQQEFLGYIGSCVDIECQKQVEEDLRLANADLDRFVFLATHDLREPIRNVAIFSELIGERLHNVMDGEERKYLDFIFAGVRRLDALANGLLKYIRVAKPGEPVYDVDSEAVIETTLATLEADIREAGAIVTHDRLPKLRVDENHLRQLFQNLIGNAIKYRGKSLPRIHLSAARVDGYWRIAVADNGIGIEPEYRDSIFGLFKRLHHADQYAGLGLGLAICQRIVSLYRGRIWVNTAFGKGTTFYFSLPGTDDFSEDTCPATAADGTV